MVKVAYRGFANQGLQKPTKGSLYSRNPKRLKPSGKPTGCRVEDVLVGWVVKELLLEEV